MYKLKHCFFSIFQHIISIKSIKYVKLLFVLAATQISVQAWRGVKDLKFLHRFALLFLFFVFEIYIIIYLVYYNTTLYFFFKCMEIFLFKKGNHAMAICFLLFVIPSLINVHTFSITRVQLVDLYLYTPLPNPNKQA